MIYQTSTSKLALISALIVPLLAAPAYAQDEQPAQETEASQDQNAQGAGGEENAIVARVGSVDIRSSDVMTHVGMLPEGVRAQPPELLIPMAVEQLVLRQLILQQDATQELAEDPAVQILADEAAQSARENVLVQFWLERELESRVTQEDIQSAYDTLQSASETELPPLDQVRGQVEQRLRQQEIETLTDELLESDLVTYYGPDGEPVDGAQTNGAGAGADDAEESDDTETETGTSSD